MSDLRLAVLTCSDSCAQGISEDACGRAVIEACEARGWLVVAYHVCASDMECVSTSLLEMTDMENADIVLTLGGIGLDPRDMTPEATGRIIERPTPGLAELVRHACSDTEATCALSRGTAGMRGRSLVINLPDGVESALASFDRAADLFESAVVMMRGQEEA